ncbi:hypothetical protein EVC62_02130 [Salinicola endophyticus]|uniref:Lipoprotein n=1 Tax=Salinicola endophyticus TaxID=1949083 RepID=A0ABY8FCW2_9GAMM|nr:hypothetical protein [Salinicola endophyticus]WFF40392.1 hypothetical protein EVC62_02130 [Salinicola endophyticus]
MKNYVISFFLMVMVSGCAIPYMSNGSNMVDPEQGRSEETPKDAVKETPKETAREKPKETAKETPKEQERVRVKLTQERVRQAEESVKEGLKDPDSAKFKDVHGTKLMTVPNAHVMVCGMVNAKNSYGGYTGMSPFMVMGPEVLFWENNPSRGFSVANSLIEDACMFGQ